MGGLRGFRGEGWEFSVCGLGFGEFRIYFYVFGTPLPPADPVGTLIRLRHWEGTGISGLGV